MSRVNLTQVIKQTNKQIPIFLQWTKTFVWSVINKKQCYYRTDVQLHEEQASLDHVQFLHSSRGR